MITEVYACGHNQTSAFVIVEEGVIVHYGSHRWENGISFEGVNTIADDFNCEVIAVICAMMLCENNKRLAVNIYTDSEDCQLWYYRNQCNSPFFQSLMNHSVGVDIYAEPWKDNQFGNDFKAACLNMCK